MNEGEGKMKMNIQVQSASEEHQEMGWVLDRHQLVDIQQKLEGSNVYVDIETIEYVLLASANKEHLIDAIE